MRVWGSGVVGRRGRGVGGGLGIGFHRVLWLIRSLFGWWLWEWHWLWRGIDGCVAILWRWSDCAENGCDGFEGWVMLLTLALRKRQLI